MAKKKTAPRKLPTPIVEKRKPRDIFAYGLSKSFLELFQACPHQCYLKYVQGWRLKASSAPALFGSAFHSVCEHDAMGSKTAEQAAEDFRKDNAAQVALGDQEAFHLDVEIVKLLHAEYKRFWRKQTEQTEWLGREVRFGTHPKDHKVSRRVDMGSSVSTPIDVALNGFIDGVFRSKSGKKKMPWVFETKTKGRVDENVLSAKLSAALDLQTVIYCYAASHIYGEPVGGVMYDVAKRTALRKGKHESTIDYLHRVKADIQADPAKYFIRLEISLSPAEIEESLQRTLDPLLRRVWLWWNDVSKTPDRPFDSPHHFINPDALERAWGKADYFDAIVYKDFSKYERT